MNDRPVLKCGTQVSEAAAVTILAEEPKYVCRAGLKLEKALEHFGIQVGRGLGVEAVLAGLQGCAWWRGGMWLQLAAVQPMSCPCYTLGLQRGSAQAVPRSPPH